jgi:hypothetical protein
VCRYRSEDPFTSDAFSSAQYPAALAVVIDYDEVPIRVFPHARKPPLQF